MPLKAYRAPGGAIVFDSKRGFAERRLELPCGRCIGCRLARAQSWALRAQHEAALHSQNAFVTLTYTEEELPEGGTLVLSDWQDFMKRLRRRIPGIRYLACGEYGRTTFRPHYHALFFGADFRDGGYQVAPNLWSNELLDEAWSCGRVAVGPFTPESAAYVARYTVKKVTGEFSEKFLERVDPGTGEVFSVAPEFFAMSRRPGLGAKFFEKYKSDLFPADFSVLSGSRVPVPRYYRDKLSVDSPELADSLSRVRREKARKSKGSAWARLRAREVILRARVRRERAGPLD